MLRFLFFLLILLVSFFNTSNLSSKFTEDIHQTLIDKRVASATVEPRQLALAKKYSMYPDRKILDVPLINQLAEPHLKNGCEVTSLAMILNYKGVKVTKNELAKKIKKVPLYLSNNKKGNPNIGFVGDMTEGPGFSVYNGPIFDLAEKYMGKRVVNLTNRPFDYLLKRVSMGSPVWVITTRNFKPNVEFRKWDTLQGTIFITYSEHSVVITGYDENYIYVNDPYGYKNRKINKRDFIDAWSIMGKQAIAIE